MIFISKLAWYDVSSNPLYIFTGQTVNLLQHSAPPGLSPAPPSQTLPEEKWTSLPPYKKAGILLRFHKHKDKNKTFQTKCKNNVVSDRGFTKCINIALLCTRTAYLSLTWLWRSFSSWQSQSWVHGAAQTWRRDSLGVKGGVSLLTF